jgi:predicted PurR-regulated permease PerM
MADDAASPSAGADTRSAPREAPFRPAEAAKWPVFVYTAGGVILVVAVRNVFVSATVVLGWAMASIIAALLLSPLVQLLDRVLPRALAIILVFVGVAAVGLGVRSAYVSELQDQVDYLAERVPDIAERIEQRDDRVGEVARELALVDRVTELTDQLQERVGTPADALRDAALAVPSYLVAFILTIFFLVFGPRMIKGAITRLPDDRSRRVDTALRGAARAVQIQVGAAIVLAALVGLAVWIGGELIDAPSPGLFALAAAGASFIPYVGIFVGWLPVVVIAIGVASLWEVALIVLVATVMQYLEATRWRPMIDGRSLYVGPAVIVISATLGFTIYGFGGLVVLAVSAVFALAVADQVATDDPDEISAGTGEPDPIPTPIDEYVEPDPEPEPELEPEPEDAVVV